MTILQGSWIWYELMTSDFAGAKAFYEAVVPEWTLNLGPAGAGDYGFVTNSDGGMTGGVMSFTAEMASHGAKPCWVGYLGVDDCRASVAAVEAAGGKCLMPPHEVPRAGLMAMVADCCGAPFYIMTPAPNPGGGESTSFSADRYVGRCGWNELMAEDAGKATAFYTGQFGWTLPDAMDMGDMGKYQFVAHDGVTTGAIMGTMPDMPVSMWNHYFWVASIDAAKAAVEANGGQVINGPMQVPGDDWIIQGIDPQGAMFSLVGAR